MSFAGTLGDGPATLASGRFVHRRMLREPNFSAIAWHDDTGFDDFAQERILLEGDPSLLSSSFQRVGVKAAGCLQKCVHVIPRRKCAAREPEYFVVAYKDEYVIPYCEEFLSGHPTVFAFPRQCPPNDPLRRQLRRAESFLPQPSHGPLKSSEPKNGNNRAGHPERDCHRLDTETRPSRDPHDEAKVRQAENQTHD
jgi:hypothetical protein